MTDRVSITLAGGVKAACRAEPSAMHLPSRPTAPRTPAEWAFAALIEMLDETIAALARLADPASFDPALSAITAEDLTALDALDAAADRARREIHVVTTDRALTAAARFMAFALTMQSPADRNGLLSTLQDTHPIFTIPERHRNAHHVREMIDRAIARFRMVVEMMDCPLSIKNGDTGLNSSAQGCVTGSAGMRPLDGMTDADLAI